MLNTCQGAGDLSDRDLLTEIRIAAEQERKATARLIVLLAQMDARRLYLGEGCSSLFTYCTHVLRLSEHAAYGRIEAARAARRYPIVVELLEAGSLTVTAVCLLAPHLTADNYRDVLNQARYKSKREVEHIVARLRPQPPVAPAVRRLPTPKARQPEILSPTAESVDDQKPARSPVSPSHPPVVVPLAPERYKVQFTISRETHDRLRRAQDLMRHSIPNGDPAEIFDRALTLLVAELERTKLAATANPRPTTRARGGSRHIPATVKREVWKRDGGQCAFVGTEGRCPETAFLEFHHLVPYAHRGPATAENIQLRCRAHNVYEAEKCFGSRSPLLAREEAPYAYSVATRSGPSSPAGDSSARCKGVEFGADIALAELFFVHAECRFRSVPFPSGAETVYLGRTAPLPGGHKTALDHGLLRSSAGASKAGGLMTRDIVWRIQLLVLLTLASAGCEVIGGIFKAGMWVGILIAVVIVGLVLMLFGRSRT